MKPIEVCDCGHARSSHSPGAACSRCGCDFYVEDSDDRAEVEREDDGTGVERLERAYERHLDEMGGSR